MFEWRIDRDVLLAALGALHGVVPQKHTLDAMTWVRVTHRLIAGPSPILEVWLEGGSDVQAAALCVRGATLHTDETFPADGSPFVLPLQGLLVAVRGMLDGEIRVGIVEDDQTRGILVESVRETKARKNQTRALLPRFNPADFPTPYQSTIQAAKGALRAGVWDGIKVPQGETLVRAIRRVLPTVALDERRPIFGGALVQIRPQEETQALSLASTDGARLSWVEVPSGEYESAFSDEVQRAFQTGVIIPREGLVALQAVGAARKKTPVLLSVHGKQDRGVDSRLVVAADPQGDYIHAVRTIPGTFPGSALAVRNRYQGDDYTPCTVNSDDLRRTLKAAQDSIPQNTGVRLVFNDNVMEVLADSSTAGLYQSELMVDFPRPMPVETLCAIRYLLDFLATAGSDESVKLWIRDRTDAIYGTSDKAPGCVWVFMPMHL